MTKSSFKQAHEFEKRRTESHSGFQPSVPLMISHTLSLISEQYEAARALCIESMAVILRKSGDSAGAKASEQMEAITFADVAGVDEAKAELEEIVEFLRNPEKYIRLGARPPSAVLLVECIIPKDDGSRLEKYYLRYSRIMRWTGLYEAHLWDKSNWNHNQNKKGKQDKQKLWHSDQTGFHVAYFD